MIIVVEGPDGAGKSTLIDNLRLVCDRHYVTLRRSGPPKKLEEIQDVVRWIEKYGAADTSTPLILDRHPFISEAVYGKVLRGGSLLDNYYALWDIEKHFRDKIDRIIYCRPPTGIIYEKVHDNLQLKGVVDRIYEITHMYDATMKLISHWGTHVIDFDWTKECEADSANLETLFFGNYDGR